MSRVRIPCMILFSLFIIAAAPARSLAAPPTAGEVIDRVIAAYGGREAMAKVRSYLMEGRLKPAEGGGGVPFTRLFARPDSLRVTITYPDFMEKRFLREGKEGWRTRAGGEVRQVDGAQFDAMVLQAARADLPWILDERRKEVKRAEAASGQEGQGTIRLELPLRKGLTLVAVVDAASYRILRSSGLMAAPPMPGMAGGSFETVFSDFRRVDGVLFPFQEENRAMGMKTGDTLIGKITLNPAFTGKDFQP